MLNDKKTYASLPVTDVAAARRFYEETLGLEPERVTEGGVMYGSGGTQFFVYPSRFRPAGHTQMSWLVSDIKAEVAARKPFIPDPYTWSSLTYRFHELILEGCGNKTMAIQGAVLQDIVATHLRTKIAQRDDNDTDERFQRVIRSYMKLISLVKAGNAAGAEKHWRSHMEGAAQYLLKDDLKTKPVVDLFA